MSSDGRCEGQSPDGRCGTIQRVGQSELGEDHDNVTKRPLRNNPTYGGVRARRGQGRRHQTVVAEQSNV
eukprot:163080-Chlamydomonas_euryale.AAC.1